MYCHKIMFLKFLFKFWIHCFSVFAFFHLVKILDRNRLQVIISGSKSRPIAYHTSNIY